MYTFSLTKAKALLSKLIELVENGEQVTITKRGKAVVKIVKSDPLRHQIPSLAEHRAGICYLGEPVAEFIRKMRGSDLGGWRDCKRWPRADQSRVILDYMYGPDEKITALLVKLNKLTSLGKIYWTVRPPPRSILSGTDDHVPIYLSAQYKGKIFGFFLQRCQSFDGDHERLYWSEQFVLAILDDEDNFLWQHGSNSSALYDLFETARRKVAGIDGIIDDLIHDDAD